MNAEKRDAMVARVQATFAKYPTWAELPVVKKRGDVTVNMVPDGMVDGQPSFSEQAYVAALYEVCAEADVTGRSAEGAAVTGDRVKP